MYSFGDLKNNVKRLEDLNKSMNITQRIKWNKNALDQKEIKNQPIEFYLRIIHYVLAEYSSDFYKKVLDIVPNLKTLTDQKFVESALNISRKIFSMNPKINVEQFLQNSKWVEKKLEFIVDLCQNIYQWQLQIDRKSKKQIKEYLPVKLSPRNMNNFDNDSDDDIQERRIDIKPTIINENFFGSFGNKPKGFSSQLDSKKQNNRHEFEEKETISINKGKPNVFPKTLKNQYAEDEEEDSDFISTSTKQNMIVHQSKPQVFQHIASPQKNEDSGNEPVTRQEFNEMLHMMSTLNTTINNLVSKFNNLQTYVNTETTKTNARISLLQQNVKIIKNNL